MTVLMNKIMNNKTNKMIKTTAIILFNSVVDKIMNKTIKKHKSLKVMNINNHIN